MLLRLSVRGQRLVLRSQNCATQRWRGCSSRHAETSVAVSKPDAVRRAAVVSAQTAFSSLPPLPSPVADAVPVANGAAELPLPEEVEPPLEEAEWLPPSSNTPLARGTLYMVSTPVGNLEDITLRALRVLRLATVVYCEDTRHTSKLMSRYGIRTPLASYHLHNEASREAEVVARLARGDAVALVCDAGTPLVSDPGSSLVAAVAEAGHPVVAVPGASALLSGLVVSGLPTHSFLFGGFLPPGPSARRKQLTRLAGAAGAATLVLFVPPHKAAATLADASAALGGTTRCCVARELTKAHEEAWRGTLDGAAAAFSQPGRARGEITLLIHGCVPSADDAACVGEAPGGLDAGEAAASVEGRLRSLMGSGGGDASPSRAAKRVAEETGVRRRDVYAAALAIAAEARGGEGAAR